MATIDYTYNSTATPNLAASASVPWSTRGGVVNVSKIHVSFPVLKAAYGTVAYTDLIQIWDIPYPCWILGVWAKVTTVEGETATGLVGVGSSAASTFLTGLALGTAGYYVPAGTETYCLINGLFFSAADTLDMIFATGSCADISLAVFDVYVAWVDCTSFS
jgi:hypothetical protein